jgi:signal peptidase I
MLPGDIVVFNAAAYDLRFPYASLRLFHTGSPQRGDMVLIIVPTSGLPAPKRVAAIPGDTVEVRENLLVINARPIEAKTLNRADFSWVPQSDKLGSLVADENGHWISYSPGKNMYRNSPPIRLAADQYFVLGDNRDESADSRDWGPLPRTSIRGKLLVVLHTGRRL